MTSFETDAGAVASPFFNPNQEQYESLASILQTAIQRTYHQLMIMMETFPHMSNTEKKIKILAYACRTRQLFMRIYALVKFIKTAHINVSNILSFLDQQSFIFVNTADYLYHLANVKLVNARLPSFSILSSVDVLTLGTYPRLPSCIKDRILPSEKITEDEKEKTVKTLNRIIQCRLALSELPSQFKNFHIENGFVDFEVRNEFEIKLTLVSDNFNLPWRLLKINFLVKDARDPNKVLINNFQVNQIHQYLQEKLNENDRPFVEIYKSLHFFVQSLQLEVLYEQMSILVSLSRFYKIVKYEKCKMFTVEYWLEYPNKSFTFTICVGENSDFLQTIHGPALHWRDHKNIDLTFRSGELLIEKIVHQIIKFRSKKRLVEVQSLFEQYSYCKSTLIEDKPAIKVQFKISNFQTETLWIIVDYYKGHFQVVFPHSALNIKLKLIIEECLNSDCKKLDSFLLNLRIWLLLKRCQTIIRSYGFKCHEEVHITSFIDTDIMNLYNRLEKNRIFVELKKQERIFIMVTIRSKEELGNSKDQLNWQKNLDIGKCKYNGELDNTKPFLKLLSLSHFKRSPQESTLHQHQILNILIYKIKHIIRWYSYNSIYQSNICVMNSIILNISSKIEKGMKLVLKIDKTRDM
ncbi:mediator of RNA polymerase II transcription subunit 14-like [Brachionus plicatilis]|uniref:Mediator of RNA polymerase II transcription subunit 14 n=1 Tax=Brachionus plicatilis TaxID=10195 RepID=A0A3M7P9G0_BRAPC|nr:mediator of RNA polymerase II transcription subunit 14-like [Brachionus plicatilis]